MVYQNENNTKALVHLTYFVIYFFNKISPLDCNLSFIAQEELVNNFQDYTIQKRTNVRIVLEECPSGKCIWMRQTDKSFLSTEIFVNLFWHLIPETLPSFLLRYIRKTPKLYKGFICAVRVMYLPFLGRVGSWWQMLGGMENREKWQEYSI